MMRSFDENKKKDRKIIRNYLETERDIVLFGKSELEIRVREREREN